MHHRYWLGEYPAAREGGLGDRHQHVERVLAVGTDRLRDKAVISREDDRGGEESVEQHELALLVPLVFVPRPLRDLDDAENLVRQDAWATRAGRD